MSHESRALAGPGSPRVLSVTSASVTTLASTNQVLVAAPGASRQIWVLGAVFTCETGSGTFALQDEDDTAISGAMTIADNGSIVLPITGNYAMPWFKVGTNKALEMDCATSTIVGFITYAVIDVG